MNTDNNNCCVSEETLILTKKGYFQIGTLIDQQVEIWNGTEWNEVVIKQTAMQRHFITIFFSNGCCLTCTPNHLFIIGNEPLKNAVKIGAQYLYPGLKLRQELLPIIDGDEPFKAPFIHGALCAFGCFREKGPLLDIMGPIAQEVLNDDNMIVTNDGAKLIPDDIPPAYYVPIKSSVENKLKWLNGFISARSYHNNMGIKLVNVNEKLLRDIQLLLTTLGCYSIIQYSDIYKIPLPNNKNIALQNYKLIIPWYYYKKLCDIGLKVQYSINDTELNPPDLLVTEIIDIGRLSPSYSFDNSENNTGIFNGILTGY